MDGHKNKHHFYNGGERTEYPSKRQSPKDGRRSHTHGFSSSEIRNDNQKE